MARNLQGQEIQWRTSIKNSFEGWYNTNPFTRWYAKSFRYQDLPNYISPEGEKYVIYKFELVPSISQITVEIVGSTCNNPESKYATYLGSTQVNVDLRVYTNAIEEDKFRLDRWINTSAGKNLLIYVTISGTVRDWGSADQ